jgi:hypothetical protein
VSAAIGYRDGGIARDGREDIWFTAGSWKKDGLLELLMFANTVVPF